MYKLVLVFIATFASANLAAQTVSLVCQLNGRIAFPTGTVQALRERVFVAVEDGILLSIEARGVDIEVSLLDKTFVSDAGTAYRAKNTSTPNKWELTVETLGGPEAKGDSSTEISIDRRTGNMLYRRSFTLRSLGETMYINAIGPCEAAPTRNKF